MTTAEREIQELVRAADQGYVLACSVTVESANKVYGVFITRKNVHLKVNNAEVKELPKTSVSNLLKPVLEDLSSYRDYLNLKYKGDIMGARQKWWDIKDSFEDSRLNFNTLYVKDDSEQEQD